MLKKRHLLLIDPQNDFCLPAPQNGEDYVGGVHGALSVPGALDDMNRVAAMIKANANSIDSITVTLDSHNPIHIAHPMFTVDSNGNHPDPFTLITHADVKSGKYRGARPEWTKVLLDYTESLEAKKNFVLCVWNPHCLIGTPGHNVVDSLVDAFQAWTLARLLNVNYVTKGSNPFTEHYGACEAEVPRDDDPSTKLNSGLIGLLQSTGPNDDIIFCGEARSHCVRTTILQIADQFSDDQISKFVMLTDATSDVPSFESSGDEFLKTMTARGMRTATTQDYF